VKVTVTKDIPKRQPKQQQITHLNRPSSATIFAN